MRVILEPITHTYKDETGRLYTPVSHIISDYKEKFDPYKVMPNGGTLISNYVAKHGHTETYWLDLWEEKKNRACEKGTAFHNLKELAINGRGIVRVGQEELNVHNIDYVWRVNSMEGVFGKLPPGVYTELCLWNYKAKIAGTADVVTIYPDKTFDIDDHKTNGKFEIEGFRGKTMKYPFNKLPDCNLGHYTVQLSLYAWMLEQHGLKCRALRLHHYTIPEDQVDNIILNGIMPNITPVIYTVDYVKQDIETLIKQR